VASDAEHLPQHEGDAPGGLAFPAFD
jgi:hypothetical protein